MAHAPPGLDDVDQRITTTIDTRAVVFAEDFIKALQDTNRIATSGNRKHDHVKSFHQARSAGRAAA